MNQAQGAIDAAKSAGAEQYAKDEYQAAIGAFEKSRTAVTQRDYRQALNYAIDARDRARDSARAAADRRAQARSDAERLLEVVTTLVARADTQLKAADAARVPRTQPANLPEALAGVREQLQESRGMLERQEYLAAGTALRAQEAEIRKILDELTAAVEAQRPRRPVRRAPR